MPGTDLGSDRGELTTACIPGDTLCVHGQCEALQCAALAVCCSPSHTARRRDRGGAPVAAVGPGMGAGTSPTPGLKSLEFGSPKDGDTSVLTEKLTLTAERLEVE